MGAALPGLGSAVASESRKILISEQILQLFPGGVVIDGSESRDPLNTSYLHTLRAGLVLGRALNGMYAPSILGKSTADIAADGATLTVSAATGTELDRRVGAGGVFRLVGPPTVGGTVATVDLSYSGTAAAGSITLAANSAVAEVQTATPDAVATAGTWTVTYAGETTAALAYNASTAAVTAAIAALPSRTAGDITAGGSALSAGAMTFTFANTMGDVPMVEIDYGSLTGPTTIAIVETTPGELAGAAVTGAIFVSGSLLIPIDGSGTPKGLQGVADGIKVTDANESDIDVQCERLIIGGMIDASQIINYPTDPTLIAWLKAQLRLQGGCWLFDDDFIQV